MIRKIYYYLQIIPIYKLVANWYEVIILFFLQGKERVLILRDGTKFIVKHHLDALIVKESYGANEYNIALKNPKVIIDIGANIGDFSILAAKKYPQAKIFAFEPDPQTHKMLLANLMLNDVSNVQAFKVAISKQKGTTVFFSHIASGLSSLTKVQDNMKKVKVEANTLKSIFKVNKIDQCDFLKIDCEGAEYEIIASISKNMAKSIKEMAIEYHNGIAKYNHEDLEKMLKERGYNIKRSAHPFEDNIGIIYATR